MNRYVSLASFRLPLSFELTSPSNDGRLQYPYPQIPYDPTNTRRTEEPKNRSPQGEDLYKKENQRSSSKAAIRRQPTELSHSQSEVSPSHDVQPFHRVSPLNHPILSNRGRLNQDEVCPSTDFHLDFFSTRISTTLRLFASSILGMCCIVFAPTPKDAMTVSEDEG